MVVAVGSGGDGGRPRKKAELLSERQKDDSLIPEQLEKGNFGVRSMCLM